MMRAPLEVADVFRDGEARFLSEYGHTLSREQRQVLRAVIRCRTAQLGGHVPKCDDCGHQRIQYNSCRNRHCPKCQAMARAVWLEKRESEVPASAGRYVWADVHDQRVANACRKP